jgi:zinc D-Ala-D-Ala carboxypeptidase
MSTKLTANFSASEFDVHEAWPDTPAMLANRQALANLLQYFRNLFNVPGRITSAYRSPDRNASVGGASHSEHMDGRAADVMWIGITDREACRRLLLAQRALTAPTFGQFIVYDDTFHVHISLPRVDGRKNNVILRALPKRADGSRSYVSIQHSEQVPDNTVRNFRSAAR